MSEGKTQDRLKDLSAQLRELDKHREAIMRELGGLPVEVTVMLTRDEALALLDAGTIETFVPNLPKANADAAINKFRAAIVGLIGGSVWNPAGRPPVNV